MMTCSGGPDDTDDSFKAVDAQIPLDIHHYHAYFRDDYVVLADRSVQQTCVFLLTTTVPDSGARAFTTVPHSGPGHLRQCLIVDWGIPMGHDPLLGTVVHAMIHYGALL